MAPDCSSSELISSTCLGTWLGRSPVVGGCPSPSGHSSSASMSGNLLGSCPWKQQPSASTPSRQQKETWSKTKYHSSLKAATWLATNTRIKSRGKIVGFHENLSHSWWKCKCATPSGTGLFVPEKWGTNKHVELNIQFCQECSLHEDLGEKPFIPNVAILIYSVIRISQRIW